MRRAQRWSHDPPLRPLLCPSAAAGNTFKTFTLPIINATVDQPNETVTLTLIDPTSAALGRPASATLTILDND